MNRLVVAVSLMSGALITGSLALAQTVYRCGNAYSTQPCADAKVVVADDARTPAQQTEARRLAVEEQRRAERMERERVTAAAAAPPVGAGSLSAPRPAAKPAEPLRGASVVHRRHPHRSQPQDDDPNRFSAAEPGSGTKTKKSKAATG